jgi:hypothetical protein
MLEPNPRNACNCDLFYPSLKGNTFLRQQPFIHPLEQLCQEDNIQTVMDYLIFQQLIFMALFIHPLSYRPENMRLYSHISPPLVISGIILGESNHFETNFTLYELTIKME